MNYLCLKVSIWFSYLNLHMKFPSLDPRQFSTQMFDKPYPMGTKSLLFSFQDGVDVRSVLKIRQQLVKTLWGLLLWTFGRTTSFDWGLPRSLISYVLEISNSADWGMETYFYETKKTSPSKPVLYLSQQIQRISIISDAPRTSSLRY